MIKVFKKKFTGLADVSPNHYNINMTKQVAIYEMNYSVSPGGTDCWEATINGYGTSSTATDFKTAGEALNWVVDRYPDEMLELTVVSLPAYEKEIHDPNLKTSNHL
jgi:hypothetical protein